MKQPRLLFIAFFFPPSRASGVYRALTTADVFTSSGWDVTVVTTDKEFFEYEIGSADHSLSSHVPPSVDVVRVPFSLSRHHQFPFSTASVLAGYLPGLSLKHNEWKSARSNQITAHSTSFPDKYRAWIDPVVRKSVEMHQAKPYDHVLATGNPYSSFEAARQISVTTGSPFTIDFRDPWTVDVESAESIGSNASLAAERQIVEAASSCIHVNQAISDAYSSKYQEVSTPHYVAMNGFDLDSLGPAHLPNQGGPLRFGMMGTVTERWPLHALAAGWLSARSHLPEGSEMVLAGHLGFFGGQNTLLRSMLPDESVGFRYMGPVPKGQVGEFNGSLDVIIAPVPDGRLVTSGKIFEALAIGVPVVCIQAAGGGARRLLDNHPFAFGCDPTPTAVARSLQQAADATKRMGAADPGRIRASMAHFERHSALEPMVAAIGAHTGAPLPP